jgi:D-alanyl-lipoteichoic acid acyltransferase DltB (MBOAT superfamily)
MMPQFVNHQGANTQDFFLGLSLFTIGLFKKVVIADSVAPIANLTFAQVDGGEGILPLAAWLGAFAYTVQLYFDFSGYADMALGVARMFGIRLPVNFNSPYQANNIIDFWRRWHMTLSHFLRDYLYIPLGGNRKGPVLKYINIIITMLLGGLWHGAGWNFLIWGALHGLFLCLNHLWIYIWSGISITIPSVIGTLFSRSLTLIAVVVAWVFFRAETTNGAMAMVDAMLQIPQLISQISHVVLTTVTFESATNLTIEGVLSLKQSVILMFAALGLSLLMPNSQSLINRLEDHALQRKSISLSYGYAVFAGVALSFTLLALNSVESSEFLYFQF